MYVKKWVKQAAGIVAAGAISYGVNHYTGDKLGLEKLIAGNKTAQSVQYQAAGALPAEKYALQKSPLELLLEKFKAENPGERIYIAWVEREDLNKKKKIVTPVIFIGGVIDDTYTEIKKVLFGELKEGENVLTGYEAGSQPVTTRPGQNPQQNQLLRIFR
jgi:hypothetical protein